MWRLLGWLLCAVCLFAAPAFSGYAANVSFVVIETGAAAQAAQGTAELWEGGIMDVFFDAGHVVSNARAKKMSVIPAEEFPEGALRDFQEADEGGSEYFIIAFLNYAEASEGAEAGAPESVRLRLYKVAPYKFLVEESALGKGFVFEDGVNGARAMAKAIVPYIGRKM